MRVPVQPIAIPPTKDEGVRYPESSTAPGIINLARGIGSAGEALFKMEVAADEERVDAEMRGITEWKLTHIDDPDTGLLGARGFNAKDVAKDKLDQFEKYVEERARALTSERQRGIFEAKINAQREVLHNIAAGHVNKEIDTASRETYGATLQGAASDYVRAHFYSTNAEADKLKATQDLENAIDNRAIMEGWDTEHYRAEQIRRRTEFHLKLVNAMAEADQYGSAMDLLEKLKGQVDEEARVALAKSIRDNGGPVIAAQKADLLWEALLPDALEENGRFNPKKFNEAFLKQTPETRSVPGLKKEIDDRVRDYERLQTIDDANAIARLQAKIDATGTYSPLSNDFRRLDDVGKQHVQRYKLAETERRSGYRGAARQAQLDYNKTVVTTVEAMDLEAQAELTDDQITDMSQGTSAWVRPQLVKIRKKAAEDVAKGKAVPFKAFQDKITGLMKRHPLGKDFISVATTWYHNTEADSKHNGTPPTMEEINNYLYEQTRLYRQKGITDYVMKDKYRYQLNEAAVGVMELNEDQPIPAEAIGGTKPPETSRSPDHIKARYGAYIEAGKKDLPAGYVLIYVPDEVESRKIYRIPRASVQPGTLIVYDPEQEKK